MFQLTLTLLQCVALYALPDSHLLAMKNILIILILPAKLAFASISRNFWYPKHSRQNGGPMWSNGGKPCNSWWEATIRTIQTIPHQSWIPGEKVLQGILQGASQHLSLASQWRWRLSVLCCAVLIRTSGEIEGTMFGSRPSLIYFLGDFVW